MDKKKAKETGKKALKWYLIYVIVALSILMIVFPEIITTAIGILSIISILAFVFGISLGKWEKLT